MKERGRHSEEGEGRKEGVQRREGGRGDGERDETEEKKEGKGGGARTERAEGRRRKMREDAGRCGKMREDDGRAGKGRQEKRKTWAGQFLIHPPTSRSPAPGGPYVNIKFNMILCLGIRGK